MASEAGGSPPTGLIIEPDPQGSIFRAGASRQSFPLTALHEIIEHLTSDEAPTALVVFEFSSAVLNPLLARGIKAMSVDRRAAERDGPHFQGDFRKVLELKISDAVYFVGPSCYQHAQGDINCLKHKMLTAAHIGKRPSCCGASVTAAPSSSSSSNPTP